jgi:hypothetical protein
MGGEKMKRITLVMAVLAVIFTSGFHCYGAEKDCPDIMGIWDFNLECVGVNLNDELVFGSSQRSGAITQQNGCVFAGNISTFVWLGALHGKGDTEITSQFGGATASGQLIGHKLDKMTFTYTYTGDTEGRHQTNCTGIGTRRVN